MIEKLRESADLHKCVFVLAFQNMRSTQVKNIRQLLPNSRFFFGNNKVSQVALGKDEMTEHNKNFRKISEVSSLPLFLVSIF